MVIIPRMAVIVNISLCFKLLYEGKFVLAFLDKGKGRNSLILGCFDAINRDGVARDKLTCFALAAGEAGFGEDIDESFARFGGWEALCEELDVIFG